MTKGLDAAPDSDTLTRLRLPAADFQAACNAISQEFSALGYNPSDSAPSIVVEFNGVRYSAWKDKERTIVYVIGKSLENHEDHEESSSHYTKLVFAAILLKRFKR